MKTLKVKLRCQWDNGKLIMPPGVEVEMDRDQAFSLADMGMVEIMPEEAPAKPAKPSNSTKAVTKKAAPENIPKDQTSEPGVNMDKADNAVTPAKDSGTAKTKASDKKAKAKKGPAENQDAENESGNFDAETVDSDNESGDLDNENQEPDNETGDSDNSDDGIPDPDSIQE